MSQININQLTFKYDTNGDDIFKDVSLNLDTDWKFGLIGRNGRGKTTLLKIIKGELVGSGTISSSVNFEYFPIEIKDKYITTMEAVKEAIAPFKLWERQMEEYACDEGKQAEYGDILEEYIFNDGYIIEEMIKKEVGLMELDIEILNRNFDTLSGGEQTKMMLIALFLRKNHFLLIDEPTNHLDFKGREVVGKYLERKKGFILVSHDRDFVDRVVDHILSINKADIEIQRGNYSTWQENKDRQDSFELGKDDKLRKDISRLQKTAKEKANWSNQIEASKIGTGVYDRGFVGHKAAKMMKRAKNIENRQNKAIEEKSKLLKNIERDEKLELFVEDGVKDTVVWVQNLSISYDGKEIFKPISFEIKKGDCLWLRGENGSGKSSLIKALIGEDIEYSGQIIKTKNISYLSQDTSHLKGSLDVFIEEQEVNETILKNNLHKLGFEKSHYIKPLEEWSEGQKKKLLLAKSLCDRAELYIWDEPLNFIDIITRKQIEKLICEVKPTMLLVEHDTSFINSVVTKVVEIG